MKRISKRVREEAARVCAACANRGEPISVTDAVAAIYGITRTEAVRTRVAKAAVEAWAWAHHNGERRPFPFDVDSLRDDYAEAEALIRTGWSPK